MRYCPVPSRSSRRGRSPSCSSRPSRGRSGAARTTLARLGREWFLTVVAVLAVLVAIRVGIPGESLPLVPVVGLAVSGDDDRNALEQLADDVETVVDQFADLDVTNLDRLEDWDWDWDRDWDWDCEGAQIRSSDFDAERSDAVGDLAEAVDELATAAADRTQQLAESERYRRAVHEITSDEDASSEEKIRRLLELGCDRLDLENGIVAHIDEETGCYEIEHAVGGLAEAGDETVLERTLCRDVVDSGDILTLSDVPEQGYADHPGYEDWDVDCYVGGRIEVDGELYGTVCFADPVPRSSFSGPERTFVDLVTRWVSHVFERREYERRLRLKDRALEAAPVGVTITDPDRPDNPIVYANEAFEDITGYTDSEWQGRNCRFLQGEATDPDRVAELREGIEAGEETTVELRNYRADGTEFWNRISIAPIEDDDGEVTNYVGFQEDVTERKERERELRESNEWLDAVIDASPAALIAIDLEDRVQLWNPAAERIFGWREGEVLGEPLPTIPDDTDVDIDAFLDRLAAGEVVTGVEIERQTKDGSVIDVSLSKAPIHGPDGEIVGVMGALEEISDRKEAERELRERERRLHEYREFMDSMLDAIDDVVYVIDEDGDLARWNEAVVDASGYSNDEIAAMEAVEFFADENHDDIAAAIADAFQTGDSRIEVPIRRADGERVPYEFVATRLEDHDGNQVIAGVGRDVSDRVEKERELERYKAFTDDVLDAIDDLFYVLDENGDVIRWNQTVADVSGYTHDEIADMHATDFFDEEGKERIRASIEEVFETGDTRVEAPYLTKDGERIPYEFVASLLEDPDGNPVEVGLGRDISDRKRYERELRERERELSRLISNVPGMVYRCRNESDVPFEFVSEGFRNLTGYDPDELVSGDIDWSTHIHVERDEDHWAEIQDAVERREPFHLTYPIETADGERRWIQEQGRGIYADDGSAEALEGVIIDITERVESERELERTTRMLEQSQQLAKVGAWELDARTEPYEVHWTDEVARIHGTGSTDEFDIDSALEFYHPEDRPIIEQAVDRAIEDGQPYDHELRIRTADGDQRWVRTIGEPIRENGRVVKLQGSFQDITDRKRREQELERYETIIQAVGDPVFTLDEEGKFQFVNEAVESLLGNEPADLIGTNVAELLPPEDFQQARDLVRELRQGDDPYGTFETRLETADGDRVDVEVLIALLPSDDGGFAGTAGVVRDITERKERERELERTTDLLKRVQRMAGVGGWEVGMLTEPRTAVWTDELFRLHFLEDDVAPDLETTIECYHPDDREFVRDQVRAAIEEETGYDYEARLQSEEGEVRWVRAHSEPIFEDGELVRYRGTVKDITDRKERERELERTQALLERVEDLASIGGWELDLRTDPPTPTWTKEQYRLHGLPPDTEPDLQTATEKYHPDDRPKVRQALEDAIAEETDYDLVARMQPSPDETRWVRGYGTPVYDDGELVKYQGALQDITEQKERELALESLHEAARGLLGTETAAEIADVVVETAADVLDAAGVALYRLEAEHNRLEPIAHTDGFERLSSAEPAVAAGRGDSAIWNAFVAGAQTVVDDPAAFDRSQVFEASVERAVVAPVGDHGVVTVAAETEPIDAGARRLIETLVATAEAAFDRLESEASLRERDAELEARNRRLRRQIAINETIRRVNQSLLAATNRAEIERTVTERLLEDDRVAFAWIGTADEGEPLEPRAWAGTDAEYLDRVSLDPRGSDEPAAHTARTGEATVIENTLTELQQEPWRRAALDVGFQSVVSVPLTVEEYRYGVLTVYATESDAFTDLERAVFAELGEAIADAIAATKTREALQAETVIELTLSIADANDVLSRIARRADAEVTYEGMGTHAGEDAVVFFETEGERHDAVESVLEDLVSVSDHRLISHDEGSCRFEAHVTGDLLATQLVRHGASPQTVRADGTETVVVADVPVGTEVRAFVESVADEHGAAELRRRQHVERPMHTRRELVSSLFDELTERQREVLRTAYFAGFFEWPRESTGQDVATMLDVSQPTVNRHLRIAQQRLFSQLFGSEAGKTAD